MCEVRWQTAPNPRCRAASASIPIIAKELINFAQLNLKNLRS